MVQNYQYRARTKQNQMVTGLIQAASVEAAKKILIKNELTPLNVSQSRTFLDYIPFRKRVSLKEKTLFARQLATMIEAGLTLSQAMQLLIRQARPTYFRQVIENVLSDIQDGFSFSTALAKFPEVFDSIFVNVVRSGELTGKLELVLGQLADTLEKDVALNAKIRGAMFYPAFIIVAMVSIALIMIVKVIPQLKDVFASAGKGLPAQTLLLISISNFLISYWYIVIIVAVVVVFGTRFWLRTASGHRLFGAFQLRIPIIRPVVEESSMARFARLLSILIASGVPLLEALRLISDIFSNQLYRDAIQRVTAQVEQGISMSVAIEQQKVFPILVGQMISIGEQSGKMDEVMLKMAGYYDQEVSARVNGLTSLIEPVIIVILGGGVGWLVTAILLPIYQISTAA